jgi:hypothetical protein
MDKYRDYGRSSRTATVDSPVQRNVYWIHRGRTGTGRTQGDQNDFGVQTRRLTNI